MLSRSVLVLCTYDRKENAQTDIPLVAIGGKYNSKTVLDFATTDAGSTFSGKSMK